MENNIKSEDCYDAVSKCKKCKCEYGYDYPSKYVKKILGRRILLSGYKDNGLCPKCDPSFKEKPKALYTSEYTDKYITQEKN
jgi:hypothetical protein